MKTYYIVVIDPSNPNAGWQVQARNMTRIEAFHFKAIGGKIYSTYSLAKFAADLKNKNTRI